MTEREGVTKYSLRFNPAPPLPWPLLAELDAWRTILFRLGLIGQDPLRYGGVGFGNVSRRLDGGRFAISGTQTGALAKLDTRHYTVITKAEPAHNRIEAAGPIEPSSESLTHATIYSSAPEVNCVLHAHSPDIWRAAARLALPATSADAAYGTPAMAAEVERLLRENPPRQHVVFTMAGHEDGVVSFGSSAREAGFRLAAVLARALEHAG